MIGLYAVTLKWLKRASETLVYHLASKNIVVIYFGFVFFINLFFISSVFFVYKSACENNSSVSMFFLLGYAAQQLIYTVLNIILVVFVEKIKKITPFIKAIIFLLSTIVLSFLLKTLNYLLSGFTIGIIDYISLLMENLRVWIFYYIISWLFFSIIERHYVLKENERN